jgi:phenylalanyl-tRNA synthetase beta subunit
MSRFKIILCPLCHGKLEIDLDTGEVYRHFEKKKEKEAVDAFDQFVGKVAEKEHCTEDTFRKATEKLKGTDLDSLFQQAAEKAKEDLEKGEDEPSEGEDVEDE